jgi:predicted amino acid racemase/D-alanyl-D-alanine dipeptidase
MLTPRIEINLGKIAHNAKTLKKHYQAKGINLIAVTKVVCGNPTVADTLVNCGINILADSRLINIKKMRSAGVQAQFLLLRSPTLSKSEDVVKHTDISLNSELVVIKRLSKFALENSTVHKIILMVDLGDLREGIMPSNLDQNIVQIKKLLGIEIVGIGANLACFGGVAPDQTKMKQLSIIANKVESQHNLKLTFISGGNSANYNWSITSKTPSRINNLRIGESIFLGCETLNRNPIPELFTDAFTLVAEVIESKIKPSCPEGRITQNVVGKKPKFLDIGLVKRTILNLGMQDVYIDGITPRMNVEILGASSDHLVINSKTKELKVGRELEFDMNYSALLSAMTSEYVDKKAINYNNAQEYCELVEHQFRKHLQLIPIVAIHDDGSQLISLLNSGFNLIFEPSIMKDYSFMVRKDVYDKIGRISKILDKQDKKLIIRSVWRSFEHQQLLWEDKVNALKQEFPDKQIEEIEELVSYFIAPTMKSMHTTGGAVDALIYDLKEDCIMDFGTNDGYNINLNDKCYPYHPYISIRAKENRKLLIDLFENEEFVVDIKEYWHFDYGNACWAVEHGENHAFYDIIENH